jgi:hypothetical protein
MCSTLNRLEVLTEILLLIHSTETLSTANFVDYFSSDLQLNCPSDFCQLNSGTDCQTFVLSCQLNNFKTMTASWTDLAKNYQKYMKIKKYKFTVYI